MSLSTKDIFKPGLGRKFVILVVLFSLAITLVTTATQLYLEYDREISRVQKTVDRIPEIYLRGLAAYLGRGDGDGIRLLLAGIIELPNFVYVGVTGNDGKEISIGDITSETVISKTFPLMYSDGGRDRSIGALRVAADPGLVYRQSIERAGVILLGNGIKTFFVSGFVLVIFYFLVARHLFHIAGFVAGLRQTEAAEPLSLKRKRGKNKPEDELDLVVGAVNRFSAKPGETTRDRSEGEGKSSLLFENVDDSIFIVDPQSARILDANNKAVERLGYPKEELLRLSVGNLHDPENPPGVENILAELREKGSRVTKLTHVGKDGSAMPVEITSRLMDYGGRQVIQSIARDITERARAEELLRASEKRFRGLIENSVQPQVVLQQLKPIFVNQAFVDQFRFDSREEVLAMADLTRTMFPEDVSAFLHESFDDFGGSIARPVVERVVLRADGSQFPAEIFLELVDWDESAAVLVTYCDISEKNRAKAALVENEERLRMILAAGKAGAWSWDLATHKNLWSDENFHLLGYTPGEIEPSYDAWVSRI
ncbi:MAG: PAS domain S-box protein, partial [bacterium]